MNITTRHKISKMGSKASEICLICCTPITLYAYGKCLHPICFRCSLRMRALCLQNYCPVCRTDLDKVIFSKSYLPEEVQFLINGNDSIPPFGIFYESRYAKELADMELQNRCPVCKILFKDFTDIRDHVIEIHKKYYCDICVTHLKLFTNERKIYQYSDLIKHLKEGDKNIENDKSQKGHPVCNFCQAKYLGKEPFSEYSARYLDHEELYKHLRKDHYFCHFCDMDGKNRYFDSYPMLRDHFRNEHYLCEEGDCKYERFTSSFKSEIELKAHIMKKHSDVMDRNTQKSVRNIDVGGSRIMGNNPFPRRREYHESGTLLPSYNTSATNNVFIDSNVNFFEESLPFQQPQFEAGPTDFPTLAASAHINTTTDDSNIQTGQDATLQSNSSSNTIPKDASFLPKPFNRTLKTTWKMNGTELLNSERAFPSLPSSSHTPSRFAHLASTNQLKTLQKNSSAVTNFPVINGHQPKTQQALTNLSLANFPTMNQERKINNSQIAPGTQNFYISTLSTINKKHNKSTPKSSTATALAPKKNTQHVLNGPTSSATSHITASHKANNKVGKSRRSRSQHDGDEEDSPQEFFDMNEYESHGITDKNVKTVSTNEFQNLQRIKPNNLIADDYSNTFNRTAFPSIGAVNSFSQLHGSYKGDEQINSLLNNNGAPSKQTKLSYIVATPKLPAPPILPSSSFEAPASNGVPLAPPVFPSDSAFNFPSLAGNKSLPANNHSLFTSLPRSPNNIKLDKRVRDEQRLKNLIYRLNGMGTGNSPDR